VTVAWNRVLQPNLDGISAADPKAFFTQVYHESDHKPFAKGQIVKLSSTSNVKREVHVNVYPVRLRKYFPLRCYRELLTADPQKIIMIKTPRKHLLSSHHHIYSRKKDKLRLGRNTDRKIEQ
jgi:hypothetical protein